MVHVSRNVYAFYAAICLLHIRALCKACMDCKYTYIWVGTLEQ